MPLKYPLFLYPFLWIGYFIYGILWFVFLLVKSCFYIEVLILQTVLTVVNTPFLVIFATSSVKKYWEGYGHDISNISKAFFIKEANMLKKKDNKKDIKSANIGPAEIPNVTPSIPKEPVPPIEKKTPYTTYHCPNCGEKFTEKMFGMLEERKETYCEFCGHRVDLKIPLSS